MTSLTVGVALLSGSIVGGVSAAAAAPDRATLIRDALAALDRADTAVRKADTRVTEAEVRLADDRRAEDEASDDFERAESAVEHERDVTRQIAVLSYIGNGTADDDDRRTVSMMFSSRSDTMDRVRGELNDRRKDLSSARRTRAATEKRLESAQAVRDDAESTRSDREREADEALSSAGAGDLPAIAYLAYRATADEVNAADPRCHLPAAVLAAIGRVRWRHGWQTAAETTLVAADTDATAPRNPYDVERAITPIAARLCATAGSLDRAAQLALAVRTVEPDRTRADIVLAVADRYGSTDGLDLGAVPSGATDVVTAPLLDDGGSLPDGDIAAMLAWGRSRIGTPYSQCLGPDARPQDPVCPPGTTRFGRGWFDCSGFVSAAYRRIGIRIPTTTTAMDRDERFMATKVATTFDPEVIRPGDVFLMDGHTGLYVGDGLILHARDIGLTLERIPAWVANATYAILRPASMS